MVETLTRDKFEKFKADYAIYGIHQELDKYRNEHSVRDDEPRVTVHTMWHPVTDYASVLEYGRSVSDMLYAIVYDEPDIRHGDQVEIRGKWYEVAGIKVFNTHYRVDVQIIEGDAT